MNIILKIKLIKTIKLTIKFNDLASRNNDIVIS